MTTDYFDQAAQVWDSNPERRALVKAVAAGIRRAMPLSPEMRAMDFGAGTGLVSFELASSVGLVYAVDPSSGMIAELRRKCAETRIGNIIPIHTADLAQAPIPDKVDLAVACMVMHHIQDVADTLKKLHQWIKPGGKLAIADLMPDEGKFHDNAVEVHHNGFDPTELSELLRQAGFAPGESSIVYRVQKSQPFPVFLLLAERN